jgi:glycosyltransferase involved in cell wall biosynthesis
MSDPKIAIIVPIYNSEKYLEQCIESLLNQTYKNIEIILIDDGSTDKSSAICDYYAKVDNRIKVIHKKNEGVSIARNTGIENTNAEKIQFLDSDDFLEANATESLLYALSDGLCDLAVGSYSLYYDNKVASIKSISPFEINSDTISVETYIGKLAIHTTDIYFGSNWNKLYDAKIIKNNFVKFEFNENYAEDFVFNLNYLMHTKEIAITSNIINNYRVESINSISKSIRNTMKLWNRSKKIHWVFKTLFCQNGVYEKFKIDIYRFLLNQIILCLRNVVNEKNLRISQRYSLIKKIVTDDYVCKNIDYFAPKLFLERLTIWFIKRKACLLLGLVYLILQLRIKILKMSRK